jgi:DNA primase
MPATKEQVDIIAQQVEVRYAANPNLVAGLLKHMGVDRMQMDDGEIRSACPIHRGDRQDSFVVWLDRDVPIWRCFTDCGEKGRLPKLVMRKYRCRYADAVAWLAQVIGMRVNLEGTVEVPLDLLEDDAVARWERAVGLTQKQQQRTPNVFPESMVAYSMQWRPGHFIDRGFPEKLLRYFQVGFVPARTWVWPDPHNPGRLQGWFEDRISIPWRDREGRLIGFDGRRLDGVKLRKYQALPGTRRSVTLYGLHCPKVAQAIDETHSLLLVEGCADCWRAYMHGMLNTVSPGGVELSREQMDLIAGMGVRTVMLYFDGDAPGQTVALRMAEQLADRHVVMNAQPPTGMDPGDLADRSAFFRPIESARTLTKEMFQ